MIQVSTEPLTRANFAPFGDVIEAKGPPSKLINQGLCGRYHDLAALDLRGGALGVSLFDAEPRALPYPLEMVERHPLGPQCFLPLHQHPFLVVVTDTPGAHLRAFVTDGAQGVNFHRGTWHGVLTPLAAPGLFAVVDRVEGEGNLQEHWFDAPYEVVAS
ncbi:MAG: ureidoglycolate lyase [Pseudomonadota bacterium]